MRISIIVPVYNRPDKNVVLKRCLDSIKKQTFKDYEIVMPENGLGWSANHNEGIRQAKGEWIKFLHMDDFFANEKSLQTIVDSLSSDVNWLVTGCGHTADGIEWINPHLATYNNQIHTGLNTIGAPSVLTIRNERPLFFDETLTWTVDVDYYKRLYKQYGKPTILNDFNVIIGLSENQATNIILAEVKAKEVEITTNRYVDKKTVLLTGIGGSIGCHFFAHIMHNTEWQVVGIDSFRHKGWSDRVAHMFKEHPEWQERLTLITHDLTAPFSELTKKKIGNVDYIINMASLSDVEASIQSPVEFIQNNVALATNMLEYARECNPEIFIQISTDEVYGPTDGKTGLNEWSPILPSNPYAASKACQEAIAISYWRTYNVPLIITNTMNNYGEMQQGNKFPVMIQKMIESGDTVKIHGKLGDIGSRSYIHSRNFASAVLFLIQNTKPYLHSPGITDRPDRYNIAGDKQLDNLELAELIASLMGKKLKYELIDSATVRPGHDKHYGLADNKLKNLGWKSPVSFEKSLKNVIEWQTSHKEWL